MKQSLYLCFFLIGLLIPSSLFSQDTMSQEVPEPAYIKTVQFKSASGQDQQAQLPILRLGEGFELSFDDIIGDEADYFYTIEHFNADWTPSALLRTEFMNGIDDVRIVTYENSVATLQLYTHYRLQVPNQFTKALTQTGNYLLTVYNEDKVVVFSRKFMIYNPAFAVGAQVKRSRDLGFVNSKHVIRFFVDGGEEPIINPKRNVKVVLFQNNNLKTALTNIEPQFTVGNKLEYRFDQETAFWAGNEFLFFENKDVRGATVAIQRIALKSLYHNYLFVDGPRSNQEYTYNPDINGNFVVTTLLGDPTIEAEYVWIHFGLDIPQLPNGEEVHVFGNFNNYVTNEVTRMKYNAADGIYELPILLKQGFYNYRYVIGGTQQNPSKGPSTISGDFWQTENEYQILVYYRRPGGRFDELLGYGTTNSTNITN